MLMSSLVSVCLMLMPFLGVKDTQKAYQIECTMYQAEMMPGNVKKQTEVLASPTLLALSGRPARFIVGGETPIPHTDPVEHLPGGLIVEVCMSSLDEKSCIIRLNAQENNVQLKTDDLLVQAGSMVTLRGKIELKKKMSMRLAGGDEGKQTWLDFTITELRP